MSESALPEGWEEATLGSVCSKPQYGWTTPARKSGDRGIKLLRTTDISGGRIDWGTVPFCSQVPDDPEKYLLRTGDILVSRAGSVGLSHVINGRCPDAAFASYLIRFRPLGDIPSAFVGLFLQSPDYWSVITEESAGIALQNINASKLSAITLPLPPLAEQRRIVAKVEGLLEQVNRARGRLARVPLILKRFRQAVLAAACSGNLTEDWRKHGRGSSLEPLFVERRRSDSRDPIDVSSLPEIPSTWVWARLPEIGELGRGRSRHRPRNDPRMYGGKYPFIQTGDVARSGGKITDHAQTYNESGLAQSRLWPAATVCITIAANIAESALLTYPVCFPDSVVGLITDRRLCYPEFAEFFIRTARASLSQYAPATAQKNINLEILSEVAIPLPPLEEQAEIVRRMVAMFQLVAVLERRVGATGGRADKLPRAILSKAFSGELVPTEAELARVEGREYESATALLARLAKSAVAAPVRKRRAERKRKATARSTS